MARFPDVPENCTILSTYQGVGWYADGWVRRTLGNLIVVGPAGVGKTETIRQAAGKDHLLVQGQASGVNVYQQVHDWAAVQKNEGPIILDDADPLFRSLSGQSFMKEIMLDKPGRRVSWGTDYTKLANQGIPNQFTLSNPVCVIINRWKTFNEHLAAVQNRSNPLFLRFSPHEVHEYVGKWFLCSPEAEAVFQFVGRFLPLISQPNIREYYEYPLKMLDAEQKLGRPNPEGNWEQMVLSKLIKGRSLEAALLFADSYPSNAERAKAFAAKGFGSARTFYRCLRRLKVGNRQECEQAIAALDAEEDRIKDEESRLASAITVLPTI